MAATVVMHLEGDPHAVAWQAANGRVHLDIGDAHTEFSVVGTPEQIHALVAQLQRNSCPEGCVPARSVQVGDRIDLGHGPTTVDATGNTPFLDQPGVLLGVEDGQDWVLPDWYPVRVLSVCAEVDDRMEPVL